MICFPNAKINLGLHVINKRDDGFHNIETVFYPVPLCDMLEVVTLKTNDEFRFNASGLEVAGATDDNLILKAFNLLKADFNLPATDIHLHKKIPMGAGLGGGSADAAFMLKLLNEKYELHLTNEQLKVYASQLGSDCTFFIDNTPSYLFGKGHELKPYNISLKGWHLVLLYPKVHSNTALAYKNVQRRETLHETSNLFHALQQPVEQWKNTVFNDFETSVFSVFPQLASLKQELYDAGATFALMSGSGSSLFGLFKEKPRLNDGLSKWVVFESVLQ